MLNLAVIFRSIRIWISVLTVSENELFLFRLAGTVLPLPALTLSLFVHSIFFPSPRLCLPLSFHLQCPMLVPFHPFFLPNSALTSSLPLLSVSPGHFLPRAGGTICSALFLKLNWLQAPAVQIAPAVPHLHRLITALRR